MSNNVIELIQLINDNPELPVIPMVETYVVADDAYDRWMASFGKSEIKEIYLDNEKVNTNKDDFVLNTAQELYESTDWTYINAVAEANKRADKLFFKAIIVYIDKPDTFDFTLEELEAYLEKEEGKWND